MWKIILIFSACLYAPLAMAQSGLSLGASSLGATLEAQLRLGPSFGLRGIAGYGEADFQRDYNGAPLIGTARVGGIGVLADLYLGGGARLSAGAIVPKFGADFAISGAITVNGAAFNNVNITGSMDSIWQYAPVAALGYQRDFGRNWGMSADIGAIYTGGFSISASDSSGQISEQDLAAELADSNARLGHISVLPFVKLGVSFAF